MTTNLLPPLLRYDGIQPLADEHLVSQFTEHDESSPSYGSTFYLPLLGITLEAIVHCRAAKRAEFGAGILA